MITTDHQGNLVSVTVFGEFTLADFKEFEAAVLNDIQHASPVSLLVDLRQMADFTVDVAWEEIKFSRQHPHDFSRIAVLTESQWIAWSAWLSHAFVDADLSVFGNLAEARAWLSEGR
ncbi:MAG: STAS/SEC14 domain-containing protein [Betaproteobacteria bacterium]|nr:STAS/SEC14 domain-containing protein [Betaproteobacteria bacterium]